MRCLPWLARAQVVQPPATGESAGHSNQTQVVDIPLVVPHQDATAIQQPPERSLHQPTPRLPAAWTSLVSRSRAGRSPTMLPIVAFEGLQSGTFARAIAAPRTGNPE